MRIIDENGEEPFPFSKNGWENAESLLKKILTYKVILAKEDDQERASTAEIKSAIHLHTALRLLGEGEPEVSLADLYQVLRKFNNDNLAQGKAIFRLRYKNLAYLLFSHIMAAYQEQGQVNSKQAQEVQRFMLEYLGCFYQKLIAKRRDSDSQRFHALNEIEFYYQNYPSVDSLIGFIDAYARLEDQCLALSRFLKEVVPYSQSPNPYLKAVHLDLIHKASGFEKAYLFYISLSRENLNSDVYAKMLTIIVEQIRNKQLSAMEAYAYAREVYYIIPQHFLNHSEIHLEMLKILHYAKIDLKLTCAFADRVIETIERHGGELKDAIYLLMMERYCREKNYEEAKKYFLNALEKGLLTHCIPTCKPQTRPLEITLNLCEKKIKEGDQAYSGHFHLNMIPMLLHYFFESIVRYINNNDVTNKLIIKVVWRKPIKNSLDSLRDLMRQILAFYRLPFPSPSNHGGIEIECHTNQIRPNLNLKKYYSSPTDSLVRYQAKVSRKKQRIPSQDPLQKNDETCTKPPL